MLFGTFRRRLSGFLVGIGVAGIVAVLTSASDGVESPAVTIGEGKGTFVFTDAKGNADKPITVWYYRPAGFTAQSPILFVMHGVKRNADVYRDAWADLAEKHKALLLCPQFTLEEYPSSAYIMGNVLDHDHHPVPAEKWTFNAVEHLFDFVKQNTGNTSEKYFIFGHSAGAQFVHRLALFLPEARYARAVAANPGWYTMPVFQGPKFPYSLDGSPCTATDLRKSFGRDFVLLLGDQDVDPNDENLRKAPEAEAQGKNRWERGHKFYATAKEAARKLGCAFAWKMNAVQGIAHSDSGMAPAAAEVLFGK